MSTMWPWSSSAGKPYLPESSLAFPDVHRTPKSQKNARGATAGQLNGEFSAPHTFRRLSFAKLYMKRQSTQGETPCVLCVIDTPLHTRYGLRPSAASARRSCASFTPASPPVLQRFLQEPCRHSMLCTPTVRQNPTFSEQLKSNYVN